MKSPQRNSHPFPFWQRYLFSTDHKVIGIQYGVTSLFFLLFGFCLIMLMRWQLAFPGQAIPVIGKFFGENRAPGGVMLPEFYLDLLPAFGRYRNGGSDRVAFRDGSPHHLLAPRVH